MNDRRMVLFKTALSGILILVIGGLLFTYGGQFITMMVQNTQRTDVEPHAEFLVGDVVQRSYTLPGTVSAFGVVKITQAPTNQSGDMRFLVFDDVNYQKWTTGGQADLAYSANNQGQFNFTFSTGKSGLYHFVFDNRASVFKKYVVFSMSYNETVKSQIADPRIQNFSWIVLLVGAVLLVMGLVRKPPLRWA